MPFAVHQSSQTSGSSRPGDAGSDLQDHTNDCVTSETSSSNRVMSAALLAMTEELGDQRLNSLPLSSAQNGLSKDYHNTYTSRPMRPVNAVPKGGHNSHWADAINSGAFHDEDYEAVKNLTRLTGVGDKSMDPFSQAPLNKGKRAIRQQFYDHKINATADGLTRCAPTKERFTPKTTSKKRQHLPGMLRSRVPPRIAAHETVPLSTQNAGLEPYELQPFPLEAVPKNAVESATLAVTLVPKNAGAESVSSAASEVDLYESPWRHPVKFCMGGVFRNAVVSLSSSNGPPVQGLCQIVVDGKTVMQQDVLTYYNHVIDGNLLILLFSNPVGGAQLKFELDFPDCYNMSKFLEQLGTLRKKAASVSLTEHPALIPTPVTNRTTYSAPSREESESLINFDAPEDKPAVESASKLLINLSDITFDEEVSFQKIFEGLEQSSKNLTRRVCIAAMDRAEVQDEDLARSVMESLVNGILVKQEETGGKFTKRRKDVFRDGLRYLTEKYGNEACTAAKNKPRPVVIAIKEPIAVQPRIGDAESHLTTSLADQGFTSLFRPEDDQLRMMTSSAEQSVALQPQTEIEKTSSMIVSQDLSTAPAPHQANVNERRVAPQRATPHRTYSLAQLMAYKTGANFARERAQEMTQNYVAKSNTNTHDGASASSGLQRISTPEPRSITLGALPSGLSASRFASPPGGKLLVQEIDTPGPGDAEFTSSEVASGCSSGCRRASSPGKRTDRSRESRG